MKNEICNSVESLVLRFQDSSSLPRFCQAWWSSLLPSADDNRSCVSMEQLFFSFVKSHVPADSRLMILQLIQHSNAFYTRFIIASKLLAFNNACSILLQVTIACSRNI